MSDLIERLFASDDSNALTNEAGRALEAMQAEIALLIKANRLRMEETRKERAEVELWFSKAQEWKAEIERLRDALIEAGRAAGAYIDDGVSTEFLMHVPKEVRLKIKQLEQKP